MDPKAIQKQDSESADIQRLQTILNALPDIVVEVNQKKEYTWANQNAYSFFGDDLIGKEANYYFVGEQKTYTQIESLFLGSQERIYVESWQRRKDGEKRLLAWWCHVIKDASGIVGAISTARDITDKSILHESLKESQEILHKIIDLLPVRIFWKDDKLRYLGCNKAFAHDAGKNLPEELIGKDDYQMSWKDQADLYRADDMHVMRSGNAKFDYEEPQTTPTGNTIWLNTNKVPILDSFGKVVGIVGTYLDITARKIIEEQLKKSEQYLNKAQAVAHVGNWEINLNTHKIWASEEAFRIYGLERTAQELPLKEVQSMALAEYRPILDKALQDLISEKNEYQVEFQIKRAADQKIRYIFSKAELVKDSSGNPQKILGVIQDITEQKEIENELRTKNEELKSINSLMVNRELKMIELKEKVAALEEKLSGNI